MPTPEPFTPGARYLPQTDTLLVLLDDKPSVHTVVDDCLTLFYEASGDFSRLSGAKFGPFSELMRWIHERWPGFHHSIKDGRVPLADILSACLWAGDGNIESPLFKGQVALREVAKRLGIVVDLRGVPGALDRCPVAKGA